MKEKHLKNMALTERMEQLMAQPKSAPSTEQQPSSAVQPENEEEAYEAFLRRHESAKKKQVAGLESSYSFLDQRMQILQSATEKAALSGKFNPGQLFSEDVNEEDQQFVLTSLASDCVIESTSKVEWLLSPGKRLEILAAMIKEDRLKEGLRQSLPKPDRFGTQLRRVLASPESLRPDRMNQEDLQALVKVLETLRELDIPKPRIEDIEPFIQSGSALADYSLLSSNFVGRVDELGRLYQFLESPNANTWDGLVVTGIGGVGKSTLLAKFTSEVMEQARATVVIIDFDRPGMNPADTGWLEMEMARQVGDLYPASRQMLYSIRDELQQRQTAYGTESIRESLHIYKILVDAVGRILRENDPLRKPLLLILDTVEEAAQRSLTQPLIHWLFEISYLLNHPLKVIFSGRLYAHQLEEFRANPQVLDIFEIEAFDKNIARKFLRLHGLDRHTAWKLVDLQMMPLRPLELKLMARLIGEGSTTLEELEKDLEGSSGSASSNELFSGLVYRRVLMRIGDPLVRTIAYPGLVLRFVTPEIVREVLAPALELGNIGEEQAEEIVDDLRSYGWLAFERDGALWHSKDLRRTMLRLMILQE
ncbi:MAG TPA: AAA family ATPase, partial [Flavisolibacter sp.]